MAKTIDYNAIIGQATSAYNQAVQGYQAQLASQQQQQQGVIAGYNNLQAGVLGGLEESSAVAGKQISDSYEKQAAQQQMQMFRQGLGNSTTRGNMLNQLTKDANFAQTDRLAKYGTIAADKRTQLGMAGLNYAGNALRDNMQFAGQGLQYMGQGGLGVANLAQGFAGMENQAAMQEAAFANSRAMQDAQFAQQNKLQKLNQLYGAGGGGGGHVGSYDRPTGQGGAVRDHPTYGGARAGGDNPYYQAQYPSRLVLGAEIGNSGGWQDMPSDFDPTGYTYNGQPIDTSTGQQGDGSGWLYEGIDY